MAVLSGSKKVTGWLLDSEQRKRIVENEDEEIEQLRIDQQLIRIRKLKEEEKELEDSDDDDYDKFMYTVVDLIRTPTSNGLTPLHIASQQDSLPMINYLLSKGALVGARSRTGDTSLHISCQNGCLPATICLLEKGASLVTLNRLGQTALMKSKKQKDDEENVYICL